MRRPWELAHMQATPAPAAGGPRVYVPFTLPDSSASTFAVLELVGFSSSPSSSQSSLPISLSAPSQLCHSQLQYPLLTAQSIDALNPAKFPADSSATSLTDSSATRAHVVVSTALNPRSGKSVQRVAEAAPCSSPPAAVASKPAVVPIHIKENVVHATSQNFKDIVQQLTGASSNDKPSIPSALKLAGTATVPTKKTLDALSVKVDASKGFKTSTPSKLQQRRKNQCNLERLCTENGQLALPISPLSPSPVTPLASYFTKSCVAVTPTASQSSGHSSNISSPEASLPESNSSNMSITMTARSKVDGSCSSGKGRASHALKSGLRQEDAPMEEALHGPAILSLFPECPL